MTPRLRDLDRLLHWAEQATALLDRCRPRNAASELARVLDLWTRGYRATPDFDYAPPPDLSRVRLALDLLAQGAQTSGPWGRLYAGRARELELEASIVEAIGTGDFRARAALRFPRGDARAACCARRWVQPPPCGTARASTQRTHVSDDARDPHSLVSSMRRAVGRLRLPFRVLTTADLASLAATGDGVILVRGGIACRRADIARVVAHELYGHALPRHRARAEAVGLFRAGTAGGSDDEEGRALLIEWRGGFLDHRRRVELGWRHLAGLSVRDGADFVQTVDLLLDAGAPVDEAVGVAARAHRGGGLAREVVYLPALARVASALQEQPVLEQWLKRGRIGVAAAAAMRDLGAPPDHIPVRDAA